MAAGRQRERERGRRGTRREGCEDREGASGFANEAGQVLDTDTSCCPVKDTAGIQSNSQSVDLPLSLSTQPPTATPGQWSLLAREVELHEHM